MFQYPVFVIWYYIKSEWKLIPRSTILRVNMYEKTWLTEHTNFTQLFCQLATLIFPLIF